MVSPFSLPESFMVKYKSIDDEHQELIDKINDWVTQLNKGVLNDFPAKILVFIDQMKAHFAKEEAYMDDVSFPGLAWHKDHHTYFITAAQELHKFALSGEKTQEEIIHTCFDYIVQDVIKADLIFASFLHGKRLL